MWEKFENNEEIFPVFDIEWQQQRQTELFTLLQNEIVHNPDIQSLWIQIFWSEEWFFSWYLSPNNRWPENGIPDGVSKIDVLCKLQNFDERLFSRLQLALSTSVEKTYMRLISYSPKINEFDYHNHTIPLFFADEVLENYIVDLDAWWRW